MVSKKRVILLGGDLEIDFELKKITEFENNESLK